MSVQIRVSYPNPSPFQKLIFENISITKYIGMRDKIGTHKLTRILNDPRIANNEELILIAKTIGKSAWILIDEYDAGKRGLTIEEMRLHERINELEKRRRFRTVSASQS